MKANYNVASRKKKQKKRKFIKFGQNGKIQVRDDQKGWVAPKRLKSNLAREFHQKSFRADFSNKIRSSHKDAGVLRKNLGITVEAKGYHSSKPPIPLEGFHNLLLPKSLCQKMFDLGFLSPTPIQAQLIPALLSGNNCLGLARTGSGKTLAFLLPMFIHVLDQPTLSSRNPIATVLAPTRELARQIFSSCRILGSEVGIDSALCVGGMPKEQVEQSFSRGIQVCIGTPNCFLDVAVVDGCTTSCARLTFLVLDEIDRMLEIGFEEQILGILGQIRRDRQMVVTSATCPPAVQRLLVTIMPNHLKISVTEVKPTDGFSSKSSPTDGLAVNSKIQQLFYFPNSRSERLPLLCNILNQEKENLSQTAAPVGITLIFTATRESCRKVYDSLQKKGYEATKLHGGLLDVSRSRNVTRFRTGKMNIMVATDIAARGLDMPSITCVINYDMPRRLRDYVHRIGRTARAFKEGISHSFFLPQDLHLASNLVKYLQTCYQQEIPERLISYATQYFNSQEGKSKRGGESYQVQRKTKEEKSLETGRKTRKGQIKQGQQSNNRSSAPDDSDSDDADSACGKVLPRSQTAAKQPKRSRPNSFRWDMEETKEFRKCVNAKRRRIASLKK